jgi:hypothetical protein
MVYDTTNDHLTTNHFELSLLHARQTMQHAALLFPRKLRQILDDAEAENNENIIAWLPPDGRSFKVHDTDQFASKILPRYFRHRKMKSFIRQLSVSIKPERQPPQTKHHFPLLTLALLSSPMTCLFGFLRYHYGFGKVDAGIDRGSFFHPKFKKDDLESCLSIDRKTARDHIGTVHDRASGRPGRCSTSDQKAPPLRVDVNKGMLPNVFVPLTSQSSSAPNRFERVRQKNLGSHHLHSLSYQQVFDTRLDEKNLSSPAHLDLIMSQKTKMLASSFIANQDNHETLGEQNFRDDVQKVEDWLAPLESLIPESGNSATISNDSVHASLEPRSLEEMIMSPDHK